METSCSTCNGTGQISFFQGESRFLLTHEECPGCFGTGLAQENKDVPAEKQEGDKEFSSS